jgi:hypothetical protein
MNDKPTSMPIAQTADEMLAQLHEIARVASVRGKYGAALSALRDIARLQGLLPSRPRRLPRKKPSRREPTLLEAADAIGAEVEVRK